MKRLNPAIIAMLALCVIGSAALAGAGLTAEQARLVRQLDEPQTTNNIRWMSTGVGREARRKAPTKDYSLLLKFTQGDRWLSFVQLCFKNNKTDEPVLSVTSGGPWLLVDLAPGTYTYHAVNNGQTRTGKVTLKQDAGQKTLLIRWPWDEGEKKIEQQRPE